MAVKNIPVAGDCDGLIAFKNKKKGLYIDESKLFRKKQTFINKDTVEGYEVVGEDSRKSVGSGVLRGAVDGALFGSIGAIAGASSGKNKGTHMVSILFKDGTKCLCELDDAMFKNLVMVLY